MSRAEQNSTNNLVTACTVVEIFLCHVRPIFLFLWLIVGVCMCHRHMVVSLCVFRYICVSVTPISRRTLKSLTQASTAHTQLNNISYLIVLDFWFRLCFIVAAHLKCCCGVFQNSQMTNLLALDLLASRPIQQLQLFTAKLRCKQVILLSWILA